MSASGPSGPLVCRLLIFLKSTFLQNSFRNTIKVSNSLDPDQARHYVRPDLVPNCLQRLSADVTSKQRDERMFTSFVLFIYLGHFVLADLLSPGSRNDLFIKNKTGCC